MPNTEPAIMYQARFYNVFPPSKKIFRDKIDLYSHMRYLTKKTISQKMQELPIAEKIAQKATKKRIKLESSLGSTLWKIKSTINALTEAVENPKTPLEKRKEYSERVDALKKHYSEISKPLENAKQTERLKERDLKNLKRDVEALNNDNIEGSFAVTAIDTAIVPDYKKIFIER